MPPQSTPSSVSPDPSQPIILPQSVPQLTESPSPAQGNPLPSPPSSSPPISKLAPGSGVLKKRNAKNLSLALPSRADSTSALSAPSTPFLGGPGSRQGLLAAGVTPRVASFGGITDNRGPPSSVFRRASDACLPSASSSSPSPSVFGLPLGPDEADPYRDGPVEILPGIYLGTEVNAADPQVLAKFRIGYVLNVAKEVSLPWDPHHILISPQSISASRPPPSNPPSSSASPLLLSRASTRSGTQTPPTQFILGSERLSQVIDSLDSEDPLPLHRPKPLSPTPLLSSSTSSSSSSSSSSSDSPSSSSSFISTSTKDTPVRLSLPSDDPLHPSSQSLNGRRPSLGLVHNLQQGLLRKSSPLTRQMSPSTPSSPSPHLQASAAATASFTHPPRSPGRSDGRLSPGLSYAAALKNLPPPGANGIVQQTVAWSRSRSKSPSSSSSPVVKRYPWGNSQAHRSASHLLPPSSKPPSSKSPSQGMEDPHSRKDSSSSPLNRSRSADIPIIEAPSSSSSSSSSAIHHPPTHTISGPLRYKKFAWGHNQENLADFFDSAFAYLDEAKSRGVGALVHCQCGVSRSASLILAYVMRERTWPLHQAYTYVKNLSSAISPNMSLVYQLVEFERVLGVHRREEDGPLPREEEMSDNEPRGLDRLPEEPVSLCTP